MEFLIIFNSSILPLFIIMAVAFIYNRLVRPDITQIANVAITVFAPIFVLDSLTRYKVTLPMLGKPMIVMALLTAAMIVSAHYVAKMVRAGEDERITLILACSMINVGNFGLPLIYFSYGAGAEAYSILNLMAFNLPLSTVAIYLSSKEKKPGKILMDIFKIPIFHAFIAAMLISQFSIPIPAAVNKSIKLAGAVAVPLFIFTLGLQLSNIRPRLSHLRIIVPGILIRLVISPVIACIILRLAGISGLAFKVAMVQTSAPAALLPLMYAIRFRRSPDLLATIIMLTTILSGLSLTILIRILE